MQLPEPSANRDPCRMPHAALDLASRHARVLKVERLLGMSALSQPLRLLEIGTISGGVAHYFATHPQLSCEVHALDVVDNQQVVDGYQYQQVAGVEQPYPDTSFDVVISNHVIEHASDAVAQKHHFAEMYRVLRPCDVRYLAVPNHWILTNTHSGLKFLSLRLRAWRMPHLRLMRQGSFYDCEPLQMRQLERMLAAAGFGYRNICIEALRETMIMEWPQTTVVRTLGSAQDALLRLRRGLISTLIH